MTQKLLLIGLDGATFDVIRPLAAAGRLPHLNKLLHEGAWGILHSTIPPISPTAWTTITTGKNPGQHGVFDFRKFVQKGGDDAVYARLKGKHKRIWDLLTDNGLRSIVVDVPFTFPPTPLNGTMLTGYGTPRTPDTVFTYPSDLIEQVPQSLRTEIRVGIPRERFDRSTAFIEEWTEVMNGRSRLLHHLMTNEPWDFFFHVFSITDNMGHVFWTYIEPGHPNYDKPEAAAYREAFFHAYEQCDAILGDMMRRAGPETTTIIISDHGFGSIYPRQYLFRRLAEGGFLRYESPPFLSLFGDRLMKLVMKAYTGMPFLRERIKNLRPQNQAALKKVLKQTSLMPSMQAIDYRRSPVLPSGFGVQLWVNDNGRFPSGPVPPEQVDPLLTKLKNFLLADKEAHTGLPIIAGANLGQEVYSGEAATLGPDLIVAYQNFYQPGNQPRHHNPFLEGGHTGDGIFLAQGPAIQPGHYHNLHLADLTPTMLHLMGQAVAADMDGRVWTELIRPSYLQASPVQTNAPPALFPEAAQSSGLTKKEEAELETQLRQLGYL